MRAETAARYIVFVLHIGPTLLVQWLYLGWVSSGDLVDGDLNLRGAYVGLVDWPALGQRVMPFRACAMIAVFSFFAAAFLRVGGERFEPLWRPAIVLPSLALWLILLGA